MNDEPNQIKSSASAKYTDVSADNEMARYGISHQTVDVYYWENYRYSTLKDALAQAKRAESSRKS